MWATVPTTLLLGVRVVALILALVVVGIAVIVGAVGGLLFVGVGVVVGWTGGRGVLRWRGAGRGGCLVSGGVRPLSDWGRDVGVYVEPGRCKVSGHGVGRLRHTMSDTCV
jgi:hypothetical protein